MSGGVDGILGVSTRPAGRGLVVMVDGEVDVYTAFRLREELGSALDAGVALVVVDLADVVFMDSTGLGVLVGGLKGARARGVRLVLAGVPDPVLKILRVTGLTKVFGVFGSVDEALAV